MWLNHWVYDFVAVTISNQPRHLAISADLVLQPIFIALFIFHIIFAFHASLEENNLRFLQKKVTIIKQSQHRKKRMFAQHHTRCYLKGNTNLLYQQHTGSPECFSCSPWIQVDLSLLCTVFLFLSLPTGFAPGADTGLEHWRERLFHHGYCHSLQSYVIA